MMNNKNLYLCVISAKSSEGREQVAKHLRYWPYVKFFKYQGDRHLLCCFHLGESKSGWQLKQLYERSRQLVLLCLRQYDVTITHWKPLPADFKLYRNRPLYTRPDDTLKPFIAFMGEMVSEESSKEASGFPSTGSGAGAMIIPHPSTLRPQPSCASILNWIKVLFPSFPKLSSL